MQYQRGNRNCAGLVKSSMQFFLIIQHWRMYVNEAKHQNITFKVYDNTKIHPSKQLFFSDFILPVVILPREGCSLISRIFLRRKSEIVLHTSPQNMTVMRVLKNRDMAIMDMAEMVDMEPMMKWILIDLTIMKRCMMIPDITGIIRILVYCCSDNVYVCIEWHNVCIWRTAHSWLLD